MRNHLFSGICLAAICISAPALAQETTSSIRGTVTAEGAPVAGASVTITHVPSGTTATSTTDAGGNFNASGLRIGGPFSVAISADGYADTTITEISLVAGQTLRLPITLEPTGADIVVTASKSGAVDLSSGPATIIGRDEIEGVASVSRDIRDVVRRDPFATIDPGQSRGVIIAGQNARLNKFSVDGLRFSDNFGLNVGGLPTARGPVPLDAIEQLSVKIAPFDISEGDFQGGAINVVLRSGTNNYTGSAFYTYSSDGLTGTKSRSSTVNLDFKSKNWGAFLAGPIIKDKLFIALSYEWLQEGTPIAIGTAGFANVVPNLTDAQIANIASIAQTGYNYDTLGVTRTTLEKDKKYTAKLDWNVSDSQRLALTYIRNDSENSATAGFSSTSTTSPSLGLASNNYQRPEKVDSFVAQLVSDWADNFHTEIRGNYRAYDLSPVPFGAFPFAQMQVCLDPTANNTPVTCSQGSTAAPGAARLYFGPDQFRHFNYVRTKQYGADFAMRWAMAGIDMKATVAWAHLDVANAFVQNAFGNYYFDSVSQFQNKQASQLALGGSITGNLNDVLASFKYDQYTFGLQGNYDAGDHFTVTFGVRGDTYAGITPPPFNQPFFDRTGIRNNAVINGKLVVQPRLSFTWEPAAEVRIRGGVGLFAGGSPDVFLGNSYSVAGVFANAITISRNADGTCTVPTQVICEAALNNVDGRTINPIVTNYLRTNTAALSLSNVNALDPEYQMESTWKSSLSIDYNPYELGFLGSGWGFGADVYFGWVKNAPIYKDLRLTVIGTAPDGRPRYATTSVPSSNANTDLFLTNTKEGHSLVLVARGSKSFDFGLSLDGSYTFQDIKDVSAMNGTTATGTYGQTAMFDPNIAALGTSDYQIRNSFKFGVNYEHAFFGDYKSRVSLFGEWRSGLPYSLTMTDLAGANGHGAAFGVSNQNNRYLLYVPLATNDPIVANTTPADAATLAALNSYIDAVGLGEWRGKVLPKNAQRSPHWFKMDVHLDQEIPLPLTSRGRVKLFADIENLPNLLNKDWGSLRQVAFPYLAPLVNVACVASATNPCAQYRYSNFQNPTIVNQTRISLWSVRLGVKVEF